MDAILPFKIKNEQKFFESALKVGYNEMEIIKFIYVVQQSDLDIFSRMHDERINILLYGWELCEDYKQKLNSNEWELPEEMETVLKYLVPWSMDIWFSKEWDKCKYLLKTALIHCLNRARDLLMRMPDMMQINWDFLLLYNLQPWNVLYLKNITVTKQKTIENGAQSIESEEMPPTAEDIAYVKLEQLPIIVLRLIKIFDQSSIDMVKTLCMRIITAWNKIHQTELETSGSRRPYIPPEDKRCLMLICHIYLMAVYESDDVKGYIIDNMINNIRFYYQGFQNSSYAMDNLEYTPARYIALTNIHLRVQKRDFFDFFIWNKYDTSLVNLFGVVSQAYKSYLLGNLLMELNNMNEDDFVTNAPLYKRLMNSYVNEREKSEIFLLNELNKVEAQRYAHNVIQTVKDVTDFKSKICKGNRMSNIGNYENSDDTVTPLSDTNIEINNTESKRDEIKEDVAGEEIEDEQERVRVKESELRLDPVFQFLPNNESILYYVYDVLAKKDYTGWHFAKIVVLVKIIGLEQNMIETWRYHPGLTTDFMLNLELKLSDHYVDLAKIFKEHPFLEQEFWLTAFYLNPTTEIYEVIKRLGMRNNRKRTDEHTKLIMSMSNIEAKYGLLSSTIDVKELATIANTDDPARDYDPLFSVLHSLRLPDSLVKDMLTAIFLPRNRSFAWAVDWVILRNRCKMIMNSSKEKKRFVDLNMAEANERLKYLIIDYEKYKNRPQLDYGSIEAGYENLMTTAEFDKESEEEEDDEEDDFEDDEDIYESKRRGRTTTETAGHKKVEEKVEDDNSQEDDPFLMGKRRTRARTAATLASFLFQTLPRTSRRKRNQKPEDETKNDEEKISAENDDKSSDSNTPLRTSPTPSFNPPNCDQNDTEIVKVPTKNLKECLKARPAFLNTTKGFQNLIDIWNVEKSDLQSVDANCVSLMESSTALQIAVKLKLLNSEINPIGSDEKEFIDDEEMIIHNAEFIVKKECDMEISDVIQETKCVEDNVEAMAIDDNKKNDVTDGVGNNNVVVNLDNLEDLGETNTKVPDQYPEEKEHAAKSGNNKQQFFPTEENSCESINSDMSTAARKDSGEFSESNTEINSKRNSLNIDTDSEIKMIQNNDSNDERNETVTQNLEERTQTKLKTQLKNLKLSLEETKAHEELNAHEQTEGERKFKESETITEEESTIEIDNELQKESKDNQEKSMQQLESSDSSSRNIISEELKDNVDNKIKNRNVESSEQFENIGARNRNKILKEPKDTDNEHGNPQNEMDQLENMEVGKHDTIANQSTDTANEDKLGETGTKQSQGKNKKIEAKQFANIEANNHDTVAEQTKDTDYEGKIIEIETKLLENNDARNHNNIAEEQNVTYNEDKNREAVSKQLKNKNETRQLENNQAANFDKISENPKDQESISQQFHQEAEQILEEIEEDLSNEKVDSVQSKDLMDLKSIEKTNSTIVLANKGESLQEDTKTVNKKSEEILNKENKREENDDCKSEIVENKAEHKGIKETAASLKALESQVELKTTAEDLIETSNSMQPIHNKGELESTASTLDLHVVSSDVVNDISQIIDQEKLRISEIRQGIKVEAEGEKLATTDCTYSDDASSDQMKFESIDVKITSHSPSLLLDDTSYDSMQSAEDQEGSDGATKYLKDLCLTRNAKILVRKLRPADLEILRQPKVKIQRMSYEKYKEKFRAKRRCIEGRSYIELEDSSNSNNSFGVNSSSSDAYHPTKVKRKIAVRRYSVRQVRTSDSDNDTNNSDDLKLSTILTKSRKRRISTPSTSQSSASQHHVTGPKSARKRGRPRKITGPKSSKQNLVVTPRSASGLKLRISNAEQNIEETDSKNKRSRRTVCDEVIQLSSSSDEYPLSDLPIIEELIEIEQYPLFEEEIII